jgi:signal transduction histidine kinase/CheY-like chemotaxis protein
LELINRAGQSFSSTLDLDDVLCIILEEVRRLLGVAASSIWLLDPETEMLICQQATGHMSESLRGWRLPLGEGIAGWVVRNDQSLIVPDALVDSRHFHGVREQTGLPLRSILAAPMRARGGVIGVVQVLDTAVDRFDQAELVLLESLTASAASAVENARLYEQAQQEIAERTRAERALQEERASLAQRVAERTAELSAANAELAHAARLKDEFLAAMSHELRTPLNGILGLSEALQEEVYGPLNDRQRHSLHTIEESGRRLFDLVNGILDIAKIEAGKLELRMGAVAVRSVCEASLRTVEQPAADKRLKVSFSMDSRVTSIQADHRRVQQILVSLLSNAVKFTPEDGAIGLEVEGDVEGEVVRLTVWDTGIGISQEEMGRLFQPFVQLDSSLSRHHAGTGLGLALVRRLTELHGGGVSLESVVGEGSRFIISIPWQQAAHNVGTQAMELQTTVSKALALESGKSGADLSDHCPLVLLADDSKAHVARVMSYLQDKGCRMIVAHSGLEAIQRAREERPDAVLMDIRVPEMDGLEAIRRIRASTAQDVASVPIIALAALAIPGDEVQCMKAGADAYLRKPVPLKELGNVIEKYLCAVAPP